MSKSAKFERFLKLLGHEDAETRRKAIIELKELADPRAIPYFIEKLQDKDSHVKTDAIWALEESADTKAVEPLLVVLQDRKQKPFVRSQVAETLGKLKAEQALEPLPIILQDKAENLEVRLAALEGISNFDAFQVIDELILKIFSDESNPEDLRYEAVGLMGELPIESSYPVLVEILQGHAESNHIRANAAYALGVFGEDTALQPLLAATTDPDEEVRYWTTNGLGHLELKEAIPRLLEILTQDDYYGIRSAAAYSLGVLKDARAIEPLIAALKDKEREVRWWVIAALGDIDDIRDVPALKKMLHDKSVKVVEWAAAILNDFPGTDVVADLDALLGNLTGKAKDSQRRRKALEKALERVRKTNARKAAEASSLQSKEA